MIKHVCDRLSRNLGVLTKVSGLRAARNGGLKLRQILSCPWLAGHTAGRDQREARSGTARRHPAIVKHDQTNHMGAGSVRGVPGVPARHARHLSAGRDRVTLRCTECRYSHSEALPEVDKHVIYLDQSIFSFLLQVEGGGRLPSGHEEWARELYRRIRRVVLLQQVVLPHSDVHRDETIVFHSPNELRAVYERIGGDVRLKDTLDVERMQMWEYAQAYIEQREPALSFDVDGCWKPIATTGSQTRTSTSNRTTACLLMTAKIAPVHTRA